MGDVGIPNVLANRGWRW